MTYEISGTSFLLQHFRLSLFYGMGVPVRTVQLKYDCRLFLLEYSFDISVGRLSGNKATDAANFQL